MRKICYLTDNDVISSGSFSLSMAIDVAERAMKAYAEKSVLYPDKVCQIFEEQYQSRINGLPATLLDDKVCGIKWISVFPNNPKAFGMPNISSMVLLSNITNGFPLAVLSGTLCSNMRTAAVGAVAAKYLCNKAPKTIGFIGAGEQAKMHLAAMKSLFPSIKECRVASRSAPSEQKFVKQMQRLFTDIAFIACDSDYAISVENADIIVTAISGQSKLLQAEWIKPGAFYCHVGGIEDSDSVPLKADKIVCDNWEMVKHRKQTISIMYQNGALTDDDIYADITDIVSGKRKGRERDDEFIYFNSVGLSYVDVALSYEIYKNCKAQDIGTYLDYSDNEIFERALKYNGKIFTEGN